MNPLQQAFVEAFEAWDSAAMATALIAMLEAFGGQAFGEETRLEIGWQCREMLDAMLVHPSVSGSMFIPEIPALFILGTGIHTAKQPETGRYISLTLRRMLSAQESPELQTRWNELGFAAGDIEVAREEVQTPAPLKGEPGYIGYDPEQPSIHRPTGDLKPPQTHTYAYALSVEAGDDSPLLQRYRAGERKQVWEELMALGDNVRNADVLPHAIVVARETMRRCHTNVERLHARLEQEEYHFREPDEAFTPPEDDIMERIADLEQRVGPLPLSLCAWYELVGAVDFSVDTEDPGDDYVEYSDPLVIGPADYALDYDEENWYREQYHIDLAPDFYHKDDVSGGSPYSIKLPDAGADAFFQDEPHDTTFVNYLRIAFGHEGFPGDPQRGYSALPEPPDDLLPI